MPIDFAADIVPRTAGTNLRIATFNAENLFSRPIAMDYNDNKKGQPFLDAFKELNERFNKPAYSDEDKQRILELMKKHGLTVTRPKNKHLEFRKIRGKLFAKKNNQLEVVATGREDWVGWIELKEKEINDRAIINTARVIAAVNADIVAMVETEDRPGLVKFNENVLGPIFDSTGRTPYPFALVIDGNDPRGIDVGVLSRHPITEISTHVFDLPGAKPIFSRDCAEYFLEVPGVAGRLILMVNHFASKGSDLDGTKLRIHQANRVRDIVSDRMSQGFTSFVVAGDLNDTPNSASLAPLTGMPALTEAVKKFANTIDPTGKRLGTYETGKQQLDYVFMSAAIAQKAKGAGIERRGYFAPNTFKSFDTVNDERDQASDHHCVWVDLSV